MTIPNSICRAVVASGRSTTGDESFVTLTVLFAPETANLDLLLDELGGRLGALAPLIISGGLAPNDPRLNLSLELVYQLEPPAPVRDAMGPTWLETVIRELVELREQPRNDAPPRSPCSITPLSPMEHLKIARTILEHETDRSGDIAYALKHVRAGIEGIAAVVGS